ncbi:DNA cytosine methyltransferase [Burkholderia pseudomallei]|uniref:DNA cytosine methyltransferase n=1 Tax=Burkholderia pseudomallei TaxID=28450 RepID=UPI000F0549F2|nr:DNA cytosine methyltransferase [Burkholderia pseudomallei]CAJ2745115.1 DNA cytosine methyltransferase [Burkholderia pseudomallei]VCJ93297.1 DNA cytosine methyltransferase [Burkholderia pseudomallei]VCJ94756.1 DNA cytosine methyltransferase [Burkholderia pseudomallei]VCJ95811.1 DNA cytosine methyltransferase [Burkholderia pseudomallei]VCJ97208.1 DNA cytosine methyltransferase [Burkholderia pseudomallei]
MRSVELFAGAGGLAIGMANAGFQHAAVVEWDHDACETFRENQRHHAHAVEGWPVHEVDARGFKFETLTADIAVVSGGPPCQPFSMGGKHQAQRDERNMFPEAVRAVRELRPKAFIFENVKGLTRESFASYFSYIHLQLQYPELSRRKGENWLQHRARLEQHHSANKGAATYNVLFDVLNAADYGVPQKRERVFFVGFRSDIGARWSFPDKTHSEDALLTSKWINGTYWDEHEIGRRRRTEVPRRYTKRVEHLRSNPSLLEVERWRTTRDALRNLPDPEIVRDNNIPNHVFTPGARTYVGHTGSLLDDPAKTLKAGYHGVPGGENMFVKDDGTVRYFTVREAARLQTFPDEYEFHGAWSQTMRQLGNAVPVKLAEVVASSVAASLVACNNNTRRTA